VGGRDHAERALQLRPRRERRHTPPAARSRTTGASPPGPTR
jgi:hypothetical protein